MRGNNTSQDLEEFLSGMSVVPSRTTRNPAYRGQLLRLAACVCIFTRVLQAGDGTHTLHIRSDQPRARMRLGNEPQRPREGNGRAEGDSNGLELGRVANPSPDEVSVGLAGAAEAAGRVVGVGKGGVGSCTRPP